MKSGVFDKKAFIQSVRDNLKNLYRKTLEEEMCIRDRC